MYTHWLSPASTPPDPSPAYGIGSRLSGPGGRGFTVALLGVDASVADRVRRHLYGLSWDFADLRLIDLGNFRKSSVDFTIPLLKELYASGILPVLLGGDAGALPAQYLAFAELNRQVGLCQVDATIRLSAERTEGEPARHGMLLDRAIHRQHAPSFHLAHLGSQRQLVDPALDRLFLARHFERFSLGQCLGQLSELEPAVRDADVFSLHLSSLAAAEAPAQEGANPSGFTLQQAGQLCYYAGNSDRLSSFGIYGSAPQLCSDREVELTMAGQAQLVWYFLHGLSRRAGDFPVTTEGLVEYVVDSKLTDRLTFWKSARTSRWWVEVPATLRGRGEERNRLVACSYTDYLQVSREGKLPERLHIAFSRY